MVSSILLKVSIGTFTHAVTNGIGNSTGTILQSAGHALHDTATGTGSFFEHIIGGVSGSLLWSVLCVIIIYLLYLKLAHHCISPVKDHHFKHTQSVPETSIASEETTSTQPSPAVADKPMHSKQKRFIVKFAKHQDKTSIAKV